MVEETGKKRREWVKNAAIIFLAVMLILTFFSNTIMNYSLPEVSAKYVYSGTLSEQIRGTATIEAADTYNIVIGESRVISSVDVRVGDRVEKGQVIFKLEDSDSEELDSAKEQLKALELEYNKMLLDTGADYTLEELDIKNLEEDIEKAKENISKIADYQKEYEKAKENTEAAQTKVDELKDKDSVYDEQLTALSSEDYASLDTAYYNRIKNAQDKISSAEATKKSADEKVEDLESELGTLDDSAIAAKKAELNKQQLLVTELTNKYYNAMANDEDTSEILSEHNNAKIDLELVSAEYNDLINKYSAQNDADSRLKYAKVAQSNAEIGYNNAKNSLTEVISNISKEIKGAKKKLADEIKSAEKELSDAQEKETAAKEKASVSVEEAEADIESKERDLETKKASLEKQKKADLESAGVAALDVESKLDDINKQKEKVAELEENAVDAEIKAQVSGVIDTISCVSGEKAEAGTTIATIQMTEKGCTATITVTNEQAKKVRVGDEAEIQYFWYGDAEATLTGIKSDSSNPQNKQLVFSVTGDVSPGQSIQLAMGGKGQQYELIVPNSSIREDNNGKFVLAVVAKSSPLGNRYMTKRVAVQVIASDDVNSAVSGELLQSDFIVATSTKPIEAGQQVRLIDSN